MHSTIKLLSLTAGALALAVALQAQPQRRGGEHPDSSQMAMRQERVQAQKVGYITERVQLTPDEAQQFWPVYNEYWAKKQELFKARREISRQARQLQAQSTGKQVGVLLQDFKKNQDQENALSAEYNARFEKILSPAKLLQYYLAEEDFKMDMMKEWRKKGK